jgi:hypothetical protein
MPCRCCEASRPSKGFKEPDEYKINALLKEATKLILDKHKQYDEGIDQWKKGWKEAFDHHLNGCPEKYDGPDG